MHNQNGTVLTHYKVGVSGLVSKNYFYNKRNFNLLILLTTLSTISSRFLTYECCLICTSPYFMKLFYIFLLNLEGKSTDFVLSSPECILTFVKALQNFVIRSGKNL